MSYSNSEYNFDRRHEESIEESWGYDSMGLDEKASSKSVRSTGNFKLCRKYISGPTHIFYFNRYEDVSTFIDEKVLEIRYTVSSLPGHFFDKVECFSTVNSKGNQVWTISCPKAGRYRNVANVICIFTLEEMRGPDDFNPFVQQIGHELDDIEDH